MSIKRGDLGAYFVGLNPSTTCLGCATFDTGLALTVSQFTHLPNGDHNSSRLYVGTEEITQRAQSRDSPMSKP